MRILTLIEPIRARLKSGISADSVVCRPDGYTRDGRLSLPIISNCVIFWRTVQRLRFIGLRRKISIACKDNHSLFAYMLAEGVNTLAAVKTLTFGFLRDPCLLMNP